MMDFLSNNFNSILEVVIIPILGAVAVYVVNFINKKTQSVIAKTKSETLDKYICMLSDTIAQCVTATNQTYVEALKKQGSFDAEAQKTAFNLTYNAVMTVLSQEALECLTEAYGDLQSHITNQIEARVNSSKK